MNDLTTALETARTALDRIDDRVPGDIFIVNLTQDIETALSTIEAELMKDPTWADWTAWLDRHYPASIFTGESGDEGPRTVVLARALAKAEAIRDEAVAALREIEWLAQGAFRGKVSALTLLDVISRARLSTPKEPTIRRRDT